MDLNKHHISFTIKKNDKYKTDYYLPVLLTRNCEVFEYVDIKKDEKKYVIDRQNINPYFVELGFFDGISRIKTNNGDDLSQKMVSYLLENLEGYEVLKSYKIKEIKSPNNSNFSEFYISGELNDSLYESSKLLVEGTDYDGMYNIIEILYNSDNKVEGFKISDYINMANPTSQNSLYKIYVPQPQATMKLIRVKFANEQEFRDWFDRVGKNYLNNSKDKETGEFLFDYLDKIETIWTNLISKSKYYNIDVNK